MAVQIVRTAAMKANFQVSSVDRRGDEPPNIFSQFSNICGTVYRQGNVLFTPDGNSLLSPVGNRVAVFDLVKFVAALLRVFHL